MATFRLACEGPTDQVTIENILCGHFGDEELYEDVRQLQPGGESDNPNGGWTRLFTYLSNHKFRDALDFLDYVIVQVDTDVAEQQGFDVQLTKNNQPLTIIEIVQAVTVRLIKQIDDGEAGFYAKNQERIIFAISVHTLEIWLFKPEGSPQNIINYLAA